MPSRPEKHWILLVDDREDDRFLMKVAIEKAGLNYYVVGLSSSLEAMAYLKGDPPYHDRGRYPFPSLVLLEIRMPPPNGFELLKWIRQNTRYKSLPVIMLTETESIQDAGTAYALGATSFFVKPLDFLNSSELHVVIQRLIYRE
jgi:CheY-like chemotaxis protein